MIRAVCIGEAMMELRPAGRGLCARAVAGDAYNTAVYLSRSLGGDGLVSFLTALGDDALSVEIAADIAAQGLNPALAFPVADGLPGLYMIELDEQGDRSFHYWRGESAARRWYAGLEAHGGEALLAGSDLVYLSGISLAILPERDRLGALAMLARLKGRVGHIAFDPNVRPRLWPGLGSAREAVEAACAVADIILPSDVDGRLIWDEPDPGRQLLRYAAFGPVEIALTAGAKDAWVRTSEGEHRVAPPPAAVVDTSGAGDSFNGAYLAARLRGEPPRTAVAAGSALAARVVAAPGALVPLALSHPEQG